MTAKGLYKLDDGNCRAANCFPARSLLQPKYEEGAGHWQVARQTAEKSKIELLLGSRATRIKWSGLPLPSTTDRPPHEKILDGVQLMKLHHVRSPSHLCSVDISNQNFSSAKEEDFEQFDSVAYINATENLLTLDVFRTFPGLRELDLSLNGLRNLTVDAGDFVHLEVLDLSYNNLSPEDVQALGVLSHLKVLHLTANGLHSLPLDLAVPDCESSPRFPALEVLLLDDNHLSHPNVFVSLANLRSLKQLNLDQNGIKEVPYLHYGSNSHFSIHPLSAKSGIREGLRSRKSAGKRLRQNPSAGLDEQPDYIILPNNKDPDRSEIIFPSPDPVIPENSPSPGITPHCKTSAGFNQEFVLPLPELRFLSLANNQIEHEEDLLAVALFPSLTELTFHGNPFTISRSGDPPLLSSFLQNKLGIKLVRKKISKLEKPRIFIPLKANRKVTSKLPKVRKRPLMVEAPQGTTFWELWTGAGTAPDIRDLEESEPLPPIRTFSVEDAGTEPAEEAEPKFTPVSVVASRSLEELLGTFPASQPSLDRLLSASAPGVQTSVEQILLGTESLLLPRRSLARPSLLDFAAASRSLLTEQDLSPPLSPEAGPPSGTDVSGQDLSEGDPLHRLSQAQLEPAPPPSSPLPDQVQEGLVSTAELPAAEQEPSSPAQEDQLQPPPLPSLPLQEQDLPHPEPPTSSPPTEEQHLPGTDLQPGPAPDAQEQPEHLPSGPDLDAQEQPEHLPAGPAPDAQEQPEHLPSGPVPDAQEQPDHLPSGPDLDVQEQPEHLPSGPDLDAQEQPDHLPSGPDLDVQEQPDHLPSGPVLDAQEQPEHLPSGPDLDAQEQPDHLPSGPVLDAQEQPEHLPSGADLDASEQPEQPEHLPSGPVPDAPEQPEHIPSGPVPDAPEQPEDLPAGPVPDAPEQPEHIPSGPVPDAPEQPEDLPAGPVLDAPEQPEHLPAGPVPDAQDQPEHLLTGAVLEAQEEPERLPAILEVQEEPEHLPAVPVLEAQDQPELLPTGPVLDAQGQPELAPLHSLPSQAEGLTESVSPTSVPTEEQDLSEIPPCDRLPSAEPDQLESVPLPSPSLQEQNLPEPVPPTGLPAGEQNVAECLPPSSEQNLSGASPLPEPPPEEQDASGPVPPAPATVQEPSQLEHEPPIVPPSVPWEPSWSLPPDRASPGSQPLGSSEPLPTFTTSGKVSRKLLAFHSSSRDLYLLLTQARQSLLEPPDEISSDMELFRSSSSSISSSEGSLDSRKSESFFMTQVADASSAHLKKEAPRPQQPSRAKIVVSQEVPEKYKGYEELLDSHTDKDPDFIEPVGIQQNVKALKKALQYPLVYRESKARLDSLQKHFVPMEKKVLRVPPPQPRQTKEQKLEQILHNMRNPSNIVEVPLVCILRRRQSNWKEYREALALLKEFQQEYKATVASCGMASGSKSSSKAGTIAGTSQSQAVGGLAGKSGQQLEEPPSQLSKEDQGL